MFTKRAKTRRTDRGVREEVVGTVFVGDDEIMAALEGSRSDRAAMARRLSTSGYNAHWRYLNVSGCFPKKC